MSITRSISWNWQWCCYTYWYKWFHLNDNYFSVTCCCCWWWIQFQWILYWIVQHQTTLKDCCCRFAYWFRERTMKELLKIFHEFFTNFSDTRPHKNEDSKHWVNIKMNAILRFFDIFWIIKMYHDICIWQKKIFFEIFSEIMVFVRMNRL